MPVQMNMHGTIELLDPVAIEQLSRRVEGAVHLPDDTAYEAARPIWNGLFDQHPALIVQPHTAQDVVHAVVFARDNDLPLAVRSGGHSLAGHSTVDGGLLIDLADMERLDIAPQRQIARVDPGLTWGEYVEAAHAYGLTTSSGDTASVGVGGLTLGGGIGWMVRKHGLTIDHLRAVELVIADGSLLRASADQHPGLFWALRGGGGNFGIATAFEFQLHPAGTILGGAVFYSAAEAEW